MTDHPNPEVLQLLSEILGDDEATLTRASRTRPSHFGQAPISAGEPFLSRRERHLLRWHREEVGRLLYEGCVLALQLRPAEAKTVFARDVVEEADWGRRRSRVLRSDRHLWPREREELRRPDSSGRFRSQWARLASSLLPSDDVAIAEACALYGEGDLESARAIAKSIVYQARGSHKRSTARTILAKYHYGVGDLNAALVEYREAALEDDPDPTGALFWLAHAFRVQDFDEVASVLSRMRDREPAPDRVIRSVVAILEVERVKGTWQSGPLRIPRGLDQQFSESAWKVFHALR